MKTEAGAEMAFYVHGLLIPFIEPSESLKTHVKERIAAIEAEAVAAERARIAEAVRGLPPYPDAMWGPFFRGVSRAAVLAQLEP